MLSIPLLSFIKSPLFKYGVVVFIVVGLLFGAYLKGARDTQMKWDLEKAITDKEIAELKTKQTEKSAEIVIKYVDRIKVVKEKGDTIVTYVDKWLTPEENANCRMPVTFNRLHNLAVQNRVPDTSTEVNAGAKGTSTTSGR
jgi:hypothetical protein